jgi:glycosyltransferase involved in cell wall biosynthesis
MICMNTRTLTARKTGAQRYASELLGRLTGRVEPIAPSRPRQGLGGHLWEQWILPRRLGDDLLFSPSNTGPAGVEKQVVSVLDLSPVDCPTCMGRAFGWWYRRLWRRLLPRVRRIIAISRFTRDRIVDHYGIDPRKIAVTHLAAGEEFRPAGPDSIDAARAAAGIPPGPYVLAVGTIQRRKNLSRLLEAWPIVSQRVGDVRLVVVGAVGTGAIYGATDLDRIPDGVHLVGRQGDAHLPGLYSGAELLVYPSLYEGFGLPPLEAMACGTPVVVSDAPALVEVVGKAGRIVDGRHADAIAEGIVASLERTDRRQMRSAAIARAEQFSWDRTAEQTAAVLAEAEAQG